MPCYPKPAVSLAAAIVLTETITVPDALTWRRFQIGCESTGTWTIQPQWSSAGVTWYKASDLLTLTGADSGTIYLEGTYPLLRLVCTRTGGALTAEVMMDDDRTSAAL